MEEAAYYLKEFCVRKGLHSCSKGSCVLENFTCVKEEKQQVLQPLNEQPIYCNNYKTCPPPRGEELPFEPDGDARRLA